MPKIVKIKGLEIGKKLPFTFIAGPCVIESESLVMQTAEFLKDLTAKLSIPFIFKASYDKANRTSVESFRGPGQEEGLKILEKIRQELDVPIISDVHTPEEVKAAGEVLDVIQIPAFLCRQTDLLVECGKTGKPVNVKKGQFVSPPDMKNAVGKIKSTGNEQIMLTERGSSFGYNNLVVDMTALALMKDLDCPVVFDATHSVQLPGGQGNTSGGRREMIPHLARAAAGVGVNAFFMEVHPDPDNGLCDGPNMWPLDKLQSLLVTLKEIDLIVKNS